MPKRGMPLQSHKVHLTAQVADGCRFRDGCPHAHDRCASEPSPFAVEARHAVRCWLYGPDGGVKPVDLPASAATVEPP